MPEQIIFIWPSRRMCTYWVDRVSSRKILQSTIDATPPSSARFLNLRCVVLYVVIHCYELVGDVIFFITYLSGDTIQQEVRKAPSPWYEMHTDLHLISNLPSRWWGSNGMHGHLSALPFWRRCWSRWEIRLRSSKLAPGCRSPLIWRQGCSTYHNQSNRPPASPDPPHTWLDQTHPGRGRNRANH